MSKQKSAGFTLIELVIVIVILGVLAAVAAPRFIDLSEDAERSSVQAQASALESASAINFAAAVASEDFADSEAINIDDCEDAGELLARPLDERFELSGDDGGETGDRLECTLDADGIDAEFTLIVVDEEE